MTELSIETIAETCHEANRVLQQVLGEEVNPPWAVLDQELKDSIMDGVLNALKGVTPRESHENWLKFKEAHGWSYGETKDFEKKTHPCFVAYDELPPEQQLKDELFTSIVRTLGWAE
jgi:hypothetical protein